MALDILIIVVVAAGLVVGFIRGAISQTAVIAGIAAGIAAARIFGERVSHIFALGGDPVDSTDYAIGYAVVFIVAFLLTWVVIKIFRRTIHAVHLGIIDRVAGALIKGFLWTLILSMALNVYLLVKGNQKELDNPAKPWRALAVRLAPATLGFLNKELS